jgi:tRNA 2-thiocytidine biosynthesis protein TtcA
VDLEKSLLRKVGQAIHDFRMIREGDRVAVGISGGKDSATLLEALLLLQKRAPIQFSICAFTIEQGKFTSSMEPVGEYLKKRGVAWTYFTDQPSLRLIEEQPGHGCDVCSRFRRRAVYEVARNLGVNVIALGHTSDDFCEALLRNAMYNGRLSALPAVTNSRDGNFRLIRPLVYVAEDLTRSYAEANNIPVIPCVCSFRTATVRRNIRELLEEQGVKESLISAMSNVDSGRLLVQSEGAAEISELVTIS